MSLRLNVATNTFYQLLGKFSTTLGTLITTVFITRVLGADKFGDYSIVLSYVTPLFIISDFGINAIIAREFSRNEDRISTHFKSVLLLRILIGIILMLLGFFILPFMGYSAVVVNSIAIGLFLVLTQSIFGACNVVFQTKLSYKFPALGQIISSVASVLLVYLAIRLGFGVFGVVFGFVAANFFMPLISLYFIRNYIKKETKIIDFTYWKDTLKKSFPLGTALILNVFMVASDRIVLSIMSEPVSVGIYSLAYKIFDVVLVLPTFFMNVMYPILVKSHKNSHIAFNNSLSFSLSVMFVSYLVISLPILFISKPLIPLIWGEDMSFSYQPLLVLMLGSLFFFMTSPFTWASVVKNKQRYLPLIYGSGFLFNLLLNIVFIPRYDYMASAFATIVTELLVLVAVIFLLVNKGNIKFRLTFKL